MLGAFLFFFHFKDKYGYYCISERERAIEKNYAVFSIPAIDKCLKVWYNKIDEI